MNCLASESDPKHSGNSGPYFNVLNSDSALSRHKSHLAIGIAIRACQAGHRVLFAAASELVARLAEAHHSGRLQQELIRLGRYPLIVVDEVLSLVGVDLLQNASGDFTFRRTAGKRSAG